MAAVVSFCSTFLLTSLVANGHSDPNSPYYWHGNGLCFENGYTPCAADNLEHTYCWGATFDGDAYRNGATWAMTNLDNQTQFFDNKVPACTSSTDVRWGKASVSGGAGEYTCLDATANLSRCDQARIHLDPNDTTSDYRRKLVSCHELGHSGGLRHDNSFGDCMGLGFDDNLWYGAHHIDHLNDNG